MFACDDSSLSLNEIVTDLDKIELKYSSKSEQKPLQISEDLQNNLEVLSKELDSLGLPSLNLDSAMLDVFHQVVQSSRDLVQIHRNAISKIKDQNIDCKTKDFRRYELYLQLDKYKENLEKSEQNCNSLQNQTYKLENQIKGLCKKEFEFKDEVKKLKSFHSSKLQELNRSIRRLRSENERLKEICNRDIVTENSTNEVALKLLKKHKINEEIYKSTIKKLQENNRELLDEVLNLKEEVILQHSK